MRKNGGRGSVELMSCWCSVPTERLPVPVPRIASAPRPCSSEHTLRACHMRRAPAGDLPAAGGTRTLEVTDEAYRRTARPAVGPASCEGENTLSPPTEVEKTTRRRALALAASALLVVLLLALAYASFRPAPAPAPEKLTIAVSSTPHAALLHLAAAKGFF